MLLLLMLTSKGMAGVPRASLVVIAATLNQFNMPEAGLLLILGVDQFLDMGRSATNVVGNSVATAGSPSGRASCTPPRTTSPKSEPNRPEGECHAARSHHPRRRAGGPRSRTVSADELTGTLKKIRDSRANTLGVRESSPPFSFLNPGGARSATRSTSATRSSRR